MAVKLIGLVFTMFLFSLVMNLIYEANPLDSQIWDPSGSGFIPTEERLNASIPRIANPQVESDTGTGFIQIGLSAFDVLIGALGNSFLIGSTVYPLLTGVFGLPDNAALVSLRLMLNLISFFLYGLAAWKIIRGVDLDD